MAFPFENLNVYKRAVSFAETVENLATDLKGKVSYSLLDQLSRAATSISLNIAEGNGRWHKGDKRQFFWIARGSTFECVPIIDILTRKNCLDEQLYQSLYFDLESIAKMLTKLVRSVDELNR